MGAQRNGHGWGLHGNGVSRNCFWNSRVKSIVDDGPGGVGWAGVRGGVEMPGVCGCLAGGRDDRGVWRRFGEFVGGRRVGRPPCSLLVWLVREPELEEAGFGWVAEGESKGRESSSSEVNS